MDPRHVWPSMIWWNGWLCWKMPVWIRVECWSSMLKECVRWRFANRLKRKFLSLVIQSFFRVLPELRQKRIGHFHRSIIFKGRLQGNGLKTAFHRTDLTPRSSSIFFSTFLFIPHFDWVRCLVLFDSINNLNIADWRHLLGRFTYSYNWFISSSKNSRRLLYNRGNQTLS